jgi:hypothetical protein
MFSGDLILRIKLKAIIFLKIGIKIYKYYLSLFLGNKKSHKNFDLSLKISIVSVGRRLATLTGL